MDGYSRASFQLKASSSDFDIFPEANEVHTHTVFSTVMMEEAEVNCETKSNFSEINVGPCASTLMIVLIISPTWVPFTQISLSPNFLCSLFSNTCNYTLVTHSETLGLILYLWLFSYWRKKRICRFEQQQTMSVTSASDQSLLSAPLSLTYPDGLFVSGDRFSYPRDSKQRTHSWNVLPAQCEATAFSLHCRF